MLSLPLTLHRIGMDLSQVIHRYIDKMQMENFSHNTTESTSLLRKVAAFIVTAVLIGFVLMFSALFFALILIVGAMAWGYLWWKTRDLRKQMRQYPVGDGVIEGEIIEGEVIREVIEGEVIRKVDSGSGS